MNMENYSEVVNTSVALFGDVSLKSVTSMAGKENILKDSTNTKTAKMSSPLKPAKRLRSGDSEILRVKRKIGNTIKMGLPVQTRNPATMAKRNARERRRVQNINHTLDNLEKILPEQYMDKKDKNKKLSKLEVLRATIDYIQTLQVVLNEDTKNNNLLLDAQMLQSFLPMHMQQMDMQNQYMGHPQAMPNMDMPPMQYAPTPVSDNWGMMTPSPAMTPQPMLQSPAPVYQPQYEPMPQPQHTQWNINNIL